MALLHIAGKTLLELVIEQFEDLLVRILLLAACISFVSMIYLFFLFPRILYGRVTYSNVRELYILKLFFLTG